MVSLLALLVRSPIGSNIMLSSKYMIRLRLAHNIHYRVRTETGWLRVVIMYLGEVAYLPLDSVVSLNLTNLVY